MALRDSHFGPNLLCVAPPYGDRAPAGSAYLLGYLKAQGCTDFGFLDLRLGAPFDFTPTYRTTGTFGESYVLDLPDLPLVLLLLRAFEEGKPLAPEKDELFEGYCLERAISPHYLHAYLGALDRYYEQCFAQVGPLEFVGFSTWTPNLYSTLLAAAHLKRRRERPFIVAGGPQVTSSKASAELGLTSGLFDVVVLGEGEETLLEVYESYRGGRGGRGVAGTVTLNASGGVDRVERKQMRLETVPVPSFEEMPLTAYQRESDYRSLPYQLSRGCTDKCTFCSEWVFWRHYRSSAPDYAVEQIQELLERYGANFIEFSDSLLNGHPRRLVQFCEQTLAKGLEFGWTSFMRAQIDAETAQLAKRAGCHGVFIGIESFSDETLALMNKRRTEADNIQAIINFVEAGIHVTAGFIPGFPGDTRHGFLHSVAVLRRLQDRYPGRIELHEEPFTVMAGAPLLGNLASAGLTAVPFGPEYLDIAPRYLPLTSPVVCSVEGTGQGLERLGRTKLVGAVKSDAPVKGTFDEGDDDVISPDVFHYEHLSGGWHVATKRSGFLHRYGLIVNDAEREEIEALEQEHYPLDPPHPDVLQKLSELEQKHIVAGSLSGPRVVNCMYLPRAWEDALLTLSPFVIARRLEGALRHRLMIVDTVTGRSWPRPAVDALILDALKSGPRSSGMLWAELSSRLRLRKPEMLRHLSDLKEAGVLVACERPVSREQQSHSIDVESRHSTASDASAPPCSAASTPSAPREDDRSPTAAFQ
ncbi:MAG TPA: radical SAM protein [Thermoanaerobaculia bacterium]|nr:radical SAM protein [Thermoanaerobaculia bacterium]